MLTHIETPLDDHEPTPNRLWAGTAQQLPSTEGHRGYIDQLRYALAKEIEQYSITNSLQLNLTSYSTTNHICISTYSTLFYVYIMKNNILSLVHYARDGQEIESNNFDLADPNCIDKLLNTIAQKTRAKN